MSENKEENENQETTPKFRSYTEERLVVMSRQMRELTINDERTLLAILMFDHHDGAGSHHYIDRVMNEERISREDFIDPDCRTLFDVLAECYREKLPMDFPSVAGYMIRKNINISGGVANFIEMLIREHIAVDFDHYLRRFRDNCLYRTALFCMQIFKIDSVNYRNFGMRYFIEKLSSDLLSICPDIAYKPNSDQLINAQQQLINQEIEEGQAAMTGLSTGYPSLDDKIYGMKPAQLIICAARPSVGKTSLGMNIACNVAQSGKRVLVFSCEMAKAELVNRIIRTYAKLDSYRIRHKHNCVVMGGEIEPLKKRVEDAVQRLKQESIYIEDEGIREISVLRSKARNIHRRHGGIDLIIVDYLQLLNTSEHKYANRQYEVAAISGELKDMARELKVPVIAMSQLSRPKTDIKNAQPQLTDLRDSGAIEQDADVVILLDRPLMSKGYKECKNDLERKLAYVNVAKNRNGEIGEAVMKFNGACTLFEELDDEERKIYEQFINQKLENKKFNPRLG